MSKEKLKKKVKADTVIDWTVKLLIVLTFLTFAGIVVVMALPVNASLKATCVETAVFAAIIEVFVLVFVVNIAINVEFSEINKRLGEIGHTISDLGNWVENQTSSKKG